MLKDLLFRGIKSSTIWTEGAIDSKAESLADNTSTVLLKNLEDDQMSVWQERLNVFLEQIRVWTESITRLKNWETSCMLTKPHLLPGIREEIWKEERKLVALYKKLAIARNSLSISEQVPFVPVISKPEFSWAISKNFLKDRNIWPETMWITNFYKNGIESILPNIEIPEEAYFLWELSSILPYEIISGIYAICQKNHLGVHPQIAQSNVLSDLISFLDERLKELQEEKDHLLISEINLLKSNLIFQGGSLY